MKKKNFKNLKLNKQSISNFKTYQVRGGTDSLSNGGPDNWKCLNTIDTDESFDECSEAVCPSYEPRC